MNDSMLGAGSEEELFLSRFLEFYRQTTAPFRWNFYQFARPSISYAVSQCRVLPHVLIGHAVEKGL